MTLLSREPGVPLPESPAARMADLRCALWDELSLSAAPQTAADAVFAASYQALLPDAARALRLLSCFSCLPWPR